MLPQAPCVCVGVRVDACVHVWQVQASPICQVPDHHRLQLALLPLGCPSPSPAPATPSPLITSSQASLTPPPLQAYGSIWMPWPFSNMDFLASATGGASGN